MPSEVTEAMLGLHKYFGTYDSIVSLVLEQHDSRLFFFGVQIDARSASIPGKSKSHSPTTPLAIIQH